MLVPLITAVALLSSAAGPTGTSATFLGWSDDSRLLAYRIDHADGRDVHFLKETGPGRAARGYRWDGDVKTLVYRMGYKATELGGQRLSKRVQAFVVRPGRTLRLALEVGKRKLHWTLWLDDVEKPGAPEQIRRGWLDDLYTEFEARAWPSPDGHWVALSFHAATPWRTRGWVEAFRVTDLPSK